MSTLREMAAKIRQAEEEQKLAEAQGKEEAYNHMCAEKIKEFEEGFDKFIPMLREEGITYSFHLNDKNYEHMGSYIEFKQGSKTLRMDYKNPNSFRLEYVPYSEGLQISYGTMQYDNWINNNVNQNKFIMFIVEGLIERPEPKEISEEI